jgi:hypothetical protein
MSHLCHIARRVRRRILERRLRLLFEIGPHAYKRRMMAVACVLVYVVGVAAYVLLTALYRWLF